MPNLFNSIQLRRPKKNVFDMSHDVKTSLDMGELVPVMCMECVPGDRFKIGCEAFLRFAPMVAPVMHRIDVYMHYFFVPNRLLWSNWEKFITGSDTPAFPTINVTETQYTDLMNYLGLPRGAAGADTAPVSAMPLAAYQAIYNEYYRDQNLIGEVDYQLIDGDNGATNFGNLSTLRRRAWQHDYFTSALPFAQKGGAVSIPLGEVTFNQDNISTLNPPSFKNSVGDEFEGPVSQLDDAGNPPYNIAVGAPGAENLYHGYDPAGTLEVGSTTINELRTAMRLQEFLEKQARGGSRYVENILSFFGVKSPDKRLQRPEYITGTKAPVNISEVLNTTGTETAPQGNMAGHGVSVTQGKYGSYFCEEHGYILGIMSVMPKTGYQQGIPKHFLKTADPYQYYWPTFAHLGEQAVEQQEVLAYGATPNATFGYVPRYAEYKFMNNMVTGDMQTTLDFWHLGRIFSSTPNLNQQFVECNPGKRIFAVEGGEDSLYAYILHKIRAVRPMPKYGTPYF